METSLAKLEKGKDFGLESGKLPAKGTRKLLQTTNVEICPGQSTSETVHNISTRATHREKSDRDGKEVPTQITKRRGEIETIIEDKLTSFKEELLRSLHREFGKGNALIRNATDIYIYIYNIRI